MAGTNIGVKSRSRRSIGISKHFPTKELYLERVLLVRGLFYTATQRQTDIVIRPTTKCQDKNWKERIVFDQFANLPLIRMGPE